MSRPRGRFGDGQVLQLRVELEGLTPPIWRRILVSDRASLQELHEVIDAALARDTSESYRFDVDGVRYRDGFDETVPHPAPDVALNALNLHPGARFSYTVDTHGEPWVHVLSVELITPRRSGQRVPLCLAGGRAGPPADCSGPAAYRELLSHWNDPHDPRSAEWRQALPEYFDPDYADVNAINATLARVRKHRPAA